MAQLAAGRQKNRYGQVFLLCLLVAATLFLPHCLIDGYAGEFFHYAGDFNDQQIPFYSYANAFLKDGGGFSWATDLGSGFVNAYSFYLLGSPFFWLSMLLPASWTPWAMVPLLCLKFALAGGGGYLWMRRWVKNDDMAVLGACLYAFSGFAVYDIFFNHFLDVVALFPYLLASLDDAVLDKKYGTFSVWLALNLLNNYFFFAGQAVFLILYFVCMCLGKKYKLNLRLFGRMAFLTVLGCVMGCVLLWPAMLSLVQNPRTIDPYTGDGYLMYGKVQQYFAIFYSAFLMPEAPYLTDMFSEGIIKWTSLTAYLPVVGIAGGLVFCRLRPRHPFARILRVCVLMAFVPVLNSLFYALNSSFYARWYYMPVLILAAATAKALETQEVSFGKANGFVTAVILSSAAFALVPNADEDGNFVLGVVENQPRFWGVFAISLLGVGLFALILKLRRSPRFATVMLAAVLGFSFVYGTVHISFTKYGQWKHDGEYVQQTYREAAALNAALPQDENFYRIDAYGCYNNMGLWLNRSCLQFFNSTVAPHILEFYPTVGVTRNVNSKPDAELYALRGLLSVRSLLVPLDKENDWLEEAQSGWTRDAECGSYVIYQNNNYLPMGFTYEYYVTEQDAQTVSEKQGGNLMMKALVLSDAQIERYGALLQPLPDALLKQAGYADYTTDCDDRRATAASSFIADKSGFTATIQLPKENLVLFSVPYDDGCTATVNGAPATVEKVDNGLIAVVAPAGENTIVLRYHTPGLREAALAAVGAWAVYLIWLALYLRGRKRRKGVVAPGCACPTEPNEEDAGGSDKPDSNATQTPDLPDLPDLPQAPDLNPNTQPIGEEAPRQDTMPPEDTPGRATTENGE